jgi:acetylserotonin N-methyltransferase
MRADPLSPIETAPSLADDSAVTLLCDLHLIPLAVRVALDLDCFEALADGAGDVAALAARLALSERAVDALMAAAAQKGFVARSGRSGAQLMLSEVGRDYLLRDGRHAQHALIAFARRADGQLPLEQRLRDAVRLGAATLPEMFGAPSWAELMAEPEFARAFTAAMSAHSRAPAAAWCEQVDLGAHRHLLDLGGGGGEHARALLARTPGLHATVTELPQVVACAEALRGADVALEARLRFVAHDFLVEQWPIADLHLLADVLHDWPEATARALVERSYAALPVGGRLLVHEMLLAPDRAGPAAAVAANLSMLLWTRGRQYTSQELAALLSEAGFQDVRVWRTLGAWGIATGIKR